MANNDVYTVVDKLAVRTVSVAAPVTNIGEKINPYVTVEINGEEKQALLSYVFSDKVPDWQDIGQYIINDIIAYNGVLYRSLIDDNVGNQPDITLAAWEPVVVETNPIIANKTYYVDGDSGSNSNSGLDWSNAKKNLDFLKEGESDAIPRLIANNALVTINVRGTVLSTSSTFHTVINNFYGSGTIRIIGEITDVQTGIAVTGWQNTIANQDYHIYLDASAESWTVNEHIGHFILITAGTGSGTRLYPITSNTATRLYTADLPNLSGTSILKIVSVPQLKGATITTPGTLINYSGGYLTLNNNSIPIILENLDTTNVLNPDQDILIEESTGDIEKCQTSQKMRYLNCLKPLTIDNTGMDLRDFSTLSIENSTVNFRFSSMYSSSSVGFGVFILERGDFNFSRSRFSDQFQHIFSEQGATVGATGTNQFEDGVAIIPRGGHNIYDEFAFGQYQHFVNCSPCIDASGGTFEIGDGNTFVNHSATTDIKVSENETKTFDDWNNQRNVSNPATGFSTVYMSTSTFFPISPRMNPEQIVTIGATGSDFKTIQSAINAITDSSVTKQYILSIAPGTYNEDVDFTGKNYIHIEGRGTGTEVVIAGTNGTLVTCPNTSFRCNNVTFQMNPTTTGALVIDSTAGGNNQFQNCAFVLQSATSGITPQVYKDSSDTALVLQNCLVTYTMTGTSAGALTHTIMEKNSTGAFLMTRVNFITSVADIDDNVVGILDNSTGQTFLSEVLFRSDATNVSYSGNFKGYKKTASGDAEIARCDFVITSEGGGTGTAIEIDTTTNDGTLVLSTSSINVSGFDNNYWAAAGTGDMIDAIANSIESLSMTTGAGNVYTTTTALVDIDDNALTTSIPANNAMTMINANTWSSSVLQRIIVDANGVSKYTGTNMVTLDITTPHALEPDAGTNKDLVLRIGNIHSHDDRVVTFTNVTNTINETSTPRANGDIVSFYNTAGTLPTGLREDIFYYVINKAVDSFQVSYTLGGAAVTFTDDGTPTNSYSPAELTGFEAKVNTDAGAPINTTAVSLVEVRTDDQICALVTSADASDINVTGGGSKIRVA